MEEVVYFLRFFDKEEHLKMFREGKIRTMNMKYYKEMEKPSLNLYTNRYDTIENSTYIINPKTDGSITKLDVPLKFGRNEFYNKIQVQNCTLLNPILISNPKLDEITNVCCIYTLPYDVAKNNEINSILDTMEHSLGNYFCLITNGTVFFEKIKAGLKKSNIIEHIDYAKVEYIDETSYTGLYGAFKKPSGLHWQREFRLKLQLKEIHSPFIFDIGDLQKISIGGKFDELRKMDFNAL